MRQFTVAFVAALTAFPALGQIETTPGLDLFGEGIVKRLKVEEHGRFAHVVGEVPNEDGRAKPIPGFDHLLVFQNGLSLRGTLVSVGSERIVWQRPDSSAPMEFERKEARRIVIRAASSADARQSNPLAPGTPIPATVKIAGAGWLFGEVRMDGDAITVKPGKDSELKLPVSAVQWLHFSRNRITAVSYQGEPLGMEGWKIGGTTALAETRDGVFQMPSSGWLGCDSAFPARFEMALTVPPKQTPRIFLQPSSPTPNMYMTGTVELMFRASDMSRLAYFNEFERHNTDYPKEAMEKAGEGPIRYRAFFDRMAERMVVLRNDTVIGDWKMREPAKAGEEREGLSSWIGMCMDGGYSNPLQIKGLRIAPWDGVVPKAGVAPVPRMVRHDQAPVPGKLEFADGVTGRLDGKSVPIEECTYFDLVQSPAELRAPEALLSLGNQGEFAVSHLEVRDGRIKASAAFQAELDLPAGMISAIAFPAVKSAADKSPDVMVFRNGDSIAGKLLSAQDGRPIRWRNALGQDWEIESGQIAGIRIGKGKAVAATGSATVEFVSGDRISGELTALAGKELQLRHQRLGDRVIPRAQVQQLFPNGALILDAGSEPETWLGTAKTRRNNLLDIATKPDADPGRVYLDGHFVVPASSGGNWETGISRTLEKLPDRYELRFRATDVRGGDPYVMVSLSAANGTPTAQIMICNSSVRIYAISGNHRFDQESEVSLAAKLSEHFSRREVRIFVDTKIGTMDVFVDGVLIQRSGQRASQRVPGIGKTIAFSSYAQQDSLCLLSDVWVGPWNGDLPQKDAPPEAAYLNNGDIATGRIGNLRDGVVVVGEGEDAIEIPLKRMTSLAFASVAPQGPPVRPVARARMADGGILTLGRYHWEGDRLKAESTVFGTIDVPEKEITELIFAPVPAQLSPLKSPKDQRPRQAVIPVEKGP